jgi:LysR family transcriptional regulator, transcription activator of glutamate synthase operon
MRGLIRAGLGIAVLPRKDRHDSSLIDIPLQDAGAHRHVGATWARDRRLPPAARRFVSFLQTSGTKVLNTRS